MHDSDQILKLSDNFFEIGIMTTALDKKVHHYGTDFPLHSNEVHTLKVIASKEGISQKELSDIMMRTKGATSVVLDKLVSKGLIIKKEQQDDMRVCSLYLTEQGHSVNKIHNDYDLSVVSEWVKGADITDEEIKITNNTIKKCLKYYTDVYLKSQENK